MTELTLTRQFDAAPERVFAFVSQTEHLLKWWGPEGMTVPVHELDLSRPGPWFSEMHAPDGKVYKVSGQVTEVDPPNSLSFTWAWHDENDEPGHESHVRFELTPKDGGTQFTLVHANLADEQSRASHEDGWTSTLRRLERLCADATT